MAQSLVVDASVFLSTLLPDEKPNLAIEKYFRSFIDHSVIIVAPALLPFEVTNSLKSAVKQQRISKGVAQKLLRDFLDIDIIYKSIDFPHSFDIAMSYQLSVYDASYIQLASKEQIELISLDRKLVAVSKKLSETAISS